MSEAVEECIALAVPVLETLQEVDHFRRGREFDRHLGEVELNKPFIQNLIKKSK